MITETSDIIGLFGGSFNPPHLGHYQSAKYFKDTLCGSGLVIMPSGIPPHKKLPPNSPTNSQRLEMCRLAFGDLGQVSDFEITSEKVTYTYYTVKHLQALYSDKRIAMLIGTDMLLSFEKWFNFEYLLNNTILAVTHRNESGGEALSAECDRLTARYSANVVLLDINPPTISSTEIRAAISCGQNASEYLSNSVLEYIKQQKLYKEQTNV